jgi:hypothetical protein
MYTDHVYVQLERLNFNHHLNENICFFSPICLVFGFVGFFQWLNKEGIGMWWDFYIFFVNQQRHLLSSNKIMK